MELQGRNLWCGYGEKSPVQKDISFTIRQGEICCLLGPNGVGKTTLLQTVLQLQKPLSGQVCVDGADLSTYSPPRRAEILAYVAQQHRATFSYRVEDVILMGRMGKLGYFSRPRGNDREIVRLVMADLGIEELGQRDYTRLSGGERQLVLIARSLAQQPRFLILDEPTAGLDYANSILVLKKVMTLREKGLGILMTTHSPEHAFLCKDKALLLSRGRSAIFGAVEDVLTQENLLAAFGTPIHVVQVTTPGNGTIRLCAVE